MSEPRTIPDFVIKTIFLNISLPPLGVPDLSLLLPLHASATCGRTQCRRHLRANDRTLPGVAGPHAGGGAEKHRVLGVLAHRTPVQWGVSIEHLRDRANHTTM